MRYIEFERQVSEIENEKVEGVFSNPIAYGIARAEFECEKFRRLIALGSQTTMRTAQAKVKQWKRQLERAEATKRRFEQLHGEGAAIVLEPVRPTQKGADTAEMCCALDLKVSEVFAELESLVEKARQSIARDLDGALQNRNQQIEELKKLRENISQMRMKFRKLLVQTEELHGETESSIDNYKRIVGLYNGNGNVANAAAKMRSVA